MVFRDIVPGARYRKMDLYICISFTKIQETPQYGVWRFVAIYLWDGVSKLRLIVDRFASDTNIAIVVSLVDSSLQFVPFHLCLFRILDEDIRTEL